MKWVRTDSQYGTSYTKQLTSTVRALLRRLKVGDTDLARLYVLEGSSPICVYANSRPGECEVLAAATSTFRVPLTCEAGLLNKGDEVLKEALELLQSAQGKRIDDMRMLLREEVKRADLFFELAIINAAPSADERDEDE